MIALLKKISGGCFFVCLVLKVFEHLDFSLILILGDFFFFFLIDFSD